MYVFVMFKIKDCHKNIYIDGNLVVESNKPVSYVDMVPYSEDKKGLYEYIDLKKIIMKKGSPFFTLIMILFGRTMQFTTQKKRFHFII